MTKPTPPLPSRLFFLDWIRILAFGVLVLYHVGMYFVSWDWHVKSPVLVTALEPWMRLSSPWRMDLLFLVSGAATAFLLARSGATGALLGSRTRRLFLPLVMGMVLIVPPQSWLEVGDKLGYTGSYAEFMVLYLQGFDGFCFAPGRCLILPTWNHLWFLPYLLLYTVLLWCAVRAGPGMLDRLARRVDRHVAGVGLLLWPILALLLARLALQSRFPDTHALVDDWSAHAHYAAMFVTGAVIARASRIWPRLDALRWWALSLALVAWLVPVLVAMSGPDLAALLRPWRVVLYCIQQWCAIVAVLGWGRRYLDRDNAARRYLTQAVFPVYILHQTLIILLARLLLPLQWPVGVQFAALVVGTLCISLVVFEVVRRMPWLSLWMGVSALPRRPAEPLLRRLRSLG